MSTEPRPTVLLIDDDRHVLDVLAEFVTILGYATVKAMTGAAGVTAVRTDPPPDVVLLDITMPGTLSGVQVLRAIKAHHPDLPVIMVTASIDLDIARATLRDGAMDYVTKPVTPARLSEVLTAAMVLAGKTPPPPR